MKSKALYHLLLDRARHVRVHGVPQAVEFINDVEDSLAVDFDKGVYDIQWRYANEQRRFHMTDAVFRFYIRGDLGQPVTLRDVRRANWDAALDLWRRMAKESEVEWPEIVEDSPDSMGLDLASSAPKKDFATLGGLSLATFFIGLFTGGMGLAAGAAITGAMLTLFSQERDGLRRAPWSGRVNSVIIMIPAAILPAFFPHDGAFVLSLVILLAFGLNFIEKHRAFSATHFYGCGGAIGALCWIAGSAGLSWGLIVFAAFFTMVTAILPPRFDKIAAYRMCGLILIGAILGLPAAPDLSVSFLTIILVIVFASLSAVGWFIGEMFTLTPWMIHALLGFIALASVITGDVQMGGAILMTSGFAVAEIVRMLAALRGTRAQPLVTPQEVVL